MDGLSSKDEQQQPSEMSSSLMRSREWTPGMVGRGRGRRAPAGRIVRKVTTREYAAYFMYDRNPPTNNTFTYGKRLYKEWVVDQYYKVEGQRLRLSGCASTRPPCVLTNIKEW